MTIFDKLDEMIKVVKIKRNVIEVNHHNDMRFFCGPGVVIVEESNGKVHILDIESGQEITYSDYISVEDTERTVEIVIFNNELTDDERMKKFYENKKKKKS